MLERRARALAAARLGGLALLLCLAAAGDPVAPESPSSSLQRPSPFTQAPSGSAVGGFAAGTVLTAGGTPQPGGVVVLRDVGNGQEAGRIKIDARGAFRLGPARTGMFLIELRSSRNRLLAVGHPFQIVQGQTSTADVRLRADAPWSARLFRNTAAAAIAAASAHAITAMGSSGRPASPQ